MLTKAGYRRLRQLAPLQYSKEFCENRSLSTELLILKAASESPHFVPTVIYIPQQHGQSREEYISWERIVQIMTDNSDSSFLRYFIEEAILAGYVSLPGASSKRRNTINKVTDTSEIIPMPKVSSKWRTAREIADAAKNDLTTGAELKRKWDSRRNFYPAAKGKKGKQRNLFDAQEVLGKAAMEGDILPADIPKILKALGL